MRGPPSLVAVCRSAMRWDRGRLLESLWVFFGAVCAFDTDDEFDTADEGMKQEVAREEIEGLTKPLKAYSIGEGFEGTASDWTEYIVWSVGVAALIFYLSGYVQINVHEKLPPDADIAPPEEDEDEDAEPTRKRTPKCD